MINLIDSKICTKCKSLKYFSDFGKRKIGKFGLNSICKICVNDRRNLYPRNRKEYDKKYYNDHKEKYKEYGREYSKIYCKTEKGKAKSKNNGAKRRSIFKNSDVSTNDILYIQKQANLCYWCGGKININNLHIDHYIPISKGGEHSIDNLVVSCNKCNLSKQAKDPIKFANSIGKLL